MGDLPKPHQVGVPGPRKNKSVPLGPADWSFWDHAAELGMVRGSFQGARSSKNGINVSVMEIHPKSPDQLLNHLLPRFLPALPERPRWL